MSKFTKLLITLIFILIIEILLIYLGYRVNLYKLNAEMILIKKLP